ncbi:MAG: pseudouridine synthase [Pseudomonadota bacterium]
MPRLAELLARNLGISKTAAARLMEGGRVTDPAGDARFDRKTVIDAGDPDAPAATVWFDGAPLPLWQTAMVLLHKPVGVVTALRDPRHATAYDLLREAPLFPELRPVGRLDLDTSGLLLWTTDGPTIQRLTHPKRRVPRTYQAALAAPFRSPPPDLVLEDGHRPEILDLRSLGADEVHPALLVPAGTEILATITIVGGAYHEVRRLFAALGSHVVGLARTQFGPYPLPIDLPAGQWRRLPERRPG